MRLRVLVPIFLAVAACADGPPEASPDAADLAAPDTTATVAAPPAFAPGEVIVQLRDRAYDGAAPIDLAGRRLIPLKLLPSGTWLMRLDDHGARVADVAADTLDAIDRLARDPAIVTAYPNLAFQLSMAPNDPEANEFTGRQSWSYSQIRMYQAWDRTQGSASVRIALIDSGRREHPELAGRWAPGYDFINNDSDPTDDPATHLGIDWAHGIHVAGIVGGIANNATGGAGICWNCPIIPLRVTPKFTNEINPAGIAFIAELEQAVAWAAGPDNGPIRAEVINFSLNHPTLTSCDDPAVANFRAQIDRAIARGVVVVSSAGNLQFTNPPTPTPRPRVPSTCPGVISVVASDATFGVPTYSTRGIGADLAAPGGGLDLDMHYGAGVGCPTAIYGSGTSGVFSDWSYRVGTSDAHCYRHLSGTSMSAPHVAGTVALMRSVRALTPAQIKAVLRLTAFTWDPWGGPSFVCPEPNGCGAGLLDANAAVDAVDSGSPVIAEVSPNQHDFGTVAASAPATRNITLRNLGFATLTVVAADPMLISGSAWFSFAYGSGACTGGQTCNRAITLAINGTSTIPIRCTPAGAGTQTAELIIPSNSVGQARVQLWCSSSGAPSLSAPSQLAFGDVPVGAILDRTVAITNVGTAPLTVSAANVTGAGFSRVGNLPPAIAAGGSATITIRCAPPTATPLTGNLALTSDGGGANVALTCNGVAPILAVVPNPIAFGDVRVGASLDRPVTFRNNGTAALVVTSASITGAGFTLLGSLPGSIAPNGSADLTLRCSPIWPLLHTGFLDVASNGGSASVPLSCNGIASILGVNPTTVAFGNVRVGTGVGRTVTLTNTGNASLNVSSAIVTGIGFSLVGGVPGPIAANGGTGIVTVRCAPPAAQVYTGNLTINSDGGAASIALTCTGVAPILAVSPTSLAFGDVRVGSADVQIVGVSNLGTAPLAVSSIAISGVPFHPFFPLPSPTTIGPNVTALVYVSCVPLATGSFGGNVSVNSDAGTATVPLTCRGVAPALAVASSARFPDVLLGSSSSVSIGLANPGTAPLAIASATVGGAGFALTSPVPPTIANGSSAVLGLTCTPATVGWKTGTLTIVHDGPGSPTVVTLACYAATGRIEVIAPAGGQLDLVPFQPQQVVIRNTGVGPLLIDELRFSDGPFTVSDVTLPATLAAGQTLSWSVTCQPGKRLGGSYAAKHYAKHDGVDGNASLIWVQCGDVYGIDPPLDPIDPTE